MTPFSRSLKGRDSPAQGAASDERSEAVAKPWVVVKRSGESLKGRDKLCNCGHFATGAGKDYLTLFRVPDQRAGENPGWRQRLAGLVQGLPWAGECVPFRDKKGSSQSLARPAIVYPPIRLSDCIHMTSRNWRAGAVQEF